MGIGTQVDFHLIYIKSGKKAFGRHPKYSLKRFTERVDSLGGKWEELRPYLRSLHEFEEVKEGAFSTFKLLG